MAKVQSTRRIPVEFEDISKWFNNHLAIDKIDFDDQRVYEYVYHNTRAEGVFQLTSQGAQRLFRKAKPKNIIDIAALTSIYRPGPLASDVDKLWLKHAEEPYDWGHPLPNETLKKTRGLLVFQEGVMALANKVAGFPLEECDHVRRLIMKRSISADAEQKKGREELEDTFVAGCVKNGVPENTAREIYQRILRMCGYSFNASHALGYAALSYWCAWLHTHYEEAWLASYLQDMSNNPEDKARSFSEVRALGYQIIDIDINLSNLTWSSLPDKKFAPSFLSLKGVGKSAIEEVLQNRPYSSIEDVLYNEDGSWRPSKFNKRALEALIKARAFTSLNCVGPGKLFSNYRHMHDVIIGHADEIKKVSKKDPFLGKKRFYELCQELKEAPDWTREEQAQNAVEIFGSVSVADIVSQTKLKELTDKGVRSVDDFDTKNLYWFVVVDCKMKTTKNKKSYAVIEVMGHVGKHQRINVWGAREPYLQHALYIAELDSNEFGKSTTSWKIRLVKQE